ncbi:MAG TPA: hypothetical protein PLE24_05800 [Chitinispirillaceae bacterium]|jgi:hypothetical protein|nr:hypothetical protein [Chitinispirillaceae bacterium]
MLNRQYLTVATLLLVFVFSGNASPKFQFLKIDPSLQSFDSFPNISSSVKFYVGTVYGSSDEEKMDTIGFTRTGRKTKAPILCSSPLSIKKSLQGLFSSKGVLAPDPSSSTFIIQVEIKDFSIKETSHALSQTIDGHVKLEVILVDPFSAENTRRMMVESQNSKTAMDTSKYAEEVMRGALESALLEAIRSLSKS